MIKGKDIKRQKYNTYETLTNPEDIRAMLEQRKPEEIDRAGHLLVEMNDGDLVNIYLSPNPKPSREALYELIYEN